VNDDYDVKVAIESDELDWEECCIYGSYVKLFSQKKLEETSLIKIEKGGFLSKTDVYNSVELLVLEGEYINEFGSYSKGTYIKLPKENEKFVRSEKGCVVFRKINYKHNNEEITVDTSRSEWLQGQGNLEVMPLSEQTALVKWPKGEKFIAHKHWGGEEIFVLSGIFMDEHGNYAANCWIRSPHLSQHFPFVEEETVIFVKTGHL